MDMEREPLVEEILRALESKRKCENDVKHMRLIVREMAESLQESQRFLQREKASFTICLDSLRRGIDHRGIDPAPAASPKIAAVATGSESESAEEKLSLPDTDLIAAPIKVVTDPARGLFLAKLQQGHQEKKSVQEAPESSEDSMPAIEVFAARIKDNASLTSDDVPRTSVCEECDAVAQPLSKKSWETALKPGMTTVAVRNIPARYGIEDLLQKWEPDGSFDFLHLPRQERRTRPLGHAFLNFVSHAYAVDFCRRWHGAELKHGQNKALDITAASIQGCRENLASLRRKNICRLHDKHLPALFRGRERLDTRSVLAGQPNEHLQ